MTGRWLALFGVYGLLLLISHWVRWQADPEGPLPFAAERVSLAEMRRDTPTGGTIRLAYRDHGMAPQPAILILHGSPVASVAMEPIAKSLQGHYRVILPDLPGFGGSTLKIADYSTRSHAHYIEALLDHLGLEQAHVIGYSMGGGVALDLMGIAPGRIRSLILLSSIGVQELELLGDHTLNHAVHGLQLAALTVLQEGVPHFGWMDRFPINRSYARNFFDTDQRPFRLILKKVGVPTLVVHGRKDFLVPYAAAAEHHRLVPQSQLVSMPEGNHLTTIIAPAKVAPAVKDFVETVEAGRGQTRANASSDRVTRSEEPFEWHRPKEHSSTYLLFLVVLLALATFVTEDLTCIMAGLMVSKGALPFVPAVAGCLIGIFIGDMLLYGAGRLFGPPALRRAPLKWMIAPHQVSASEAFFQRQGPALIFGTRFLPGTRLAAYFAAGMFRAPFWAFVGWFLLAAIVWTPFLVGLAAWLGGAMLIFFERFERFALLGVVLVVVCLWLLLKIAVPLGTYRGRRLLWSSWRRFRQWEFWPMWVFYPPVALYVVWLGIKHRCLTLFTCVNPTIPHGGVVLESKSAILDGFGGASEIARYRLLKGATVEERCHDLEAFMTEEGLDYPMVLKPDVGERGAGVRVARDETEANAYLASGEPTMVIAQEYVSGREFGVFYVKWPSRPKGEILSITDKRLIHVTGDGSSTLERLILDDPRAVCMARFFLKRFAMRLSEVPANEERVRLTDVGTHCRGALFLDGAKFKTGALEDAIGRLSERHQGFFFGRYDLRVPREENLMTGEGIKVLELNGVTSESTHIYDPKHSLIHAYRALCKQWRIAFEIGSENHQKGVRPTKLLDLVRLIARMKSAS